MRTVLISLGTLNHYSHLGPLATVAKHDAQTSTEAISRFAVRNMKETRMRANTVESFWHSVDSSDPDGCWPWTLGMGRGGYGKVKYRNKTWSTHRLAYTLAKGVIPSGLQINHSCDNRLCCNPDHLEAGTQKENIGAAVSRGRMASGDRQGLRLHPERSPKGERNGSAKLTAEQVTAIRQSTLARAELATIYGVSLAAINFVMQRRTWKHIT